MDVWFDSGVSSEAVLSSGNYDSLEFPADLYLEGSDQHRGWFQSSLIPAVAIKGKAPYKAVLTHGFLVDGQGKKMSKSLGNGLDPLQIINKYGADVLRLWVASSDYREDVRISDEIIKGHTDTYRKIRNTIRFMLGNVSDITVSNIIKFVDMNEIDKYSLWKLNELIKQAQAGFENYEFHKVVKVVNDFCTVFLSGFYLDALKDILYCDKVDSIARRSAQSAMLEIVTTIVELMAPILTFTMHEAWTEIKKINKDLPEFVTLADFPQEKQEYKLDKDVLEKWETLVAIKQQVLAETEKLRKDKVIGSNLEASLVIKYSSKYANALKDIDLVNIVFGSWDIKLKQVDNMEGFSIIVGKSSFGKCQRCWRHIEGINEDGLCPRCASAIR